MCAMRGCGETIPIGHLMCRRHWFSVPIELRSEVNGALRGWLAGKVPIGMLRLAQEEAIKAVKAPSNST
jgi:hypothetical protein